MTIDTRSIQNRAISDESGFFSTASLSYNRLFTAKTYCTCSSIWDDHQPEPNADQPMAMCPAQDRLRQLQRHIVNVFAIEPPPHLHHFHSGLPPVLLQPSAESAVA